MPVGYGFAMWSYGVDTVHDGRDTVMPRKKLALFRSTVSSSCLKQIEPPEPLPGERRSNTVYPDSMRRYGVFAMGPGVHTAAMPGLKSGTV